MKKYLFILLLLCMAVPPIVAQESTPRAVVIPETPVAGSVVNIQYNPAGGPMQGQVDISGVIYMFNDYRWDTFGFDITPDGNGAYTASYDLPEDCAFIALKFVAKDRNGQIVGSDNGDDKGFIYVVRGADGRQQPGAALAWGIFRKPSLGKGIYDYYKEFEIDDQAMLMWVFREVEMYGQNMPKFFDSFIAAVKQTSGENFPLAAEEIARQYLSMPDLAEKSYIQVRDLYRFQLKDTVKADSIEAVILEKWPRGEAARAKAHGKIRDNMGGGDVVETFGAFLSEFPVGEWQQHPEHAHQEFMYYTTYRTFIEVLMGSEQYDRARSYADEMYFKALNETYRWNIEGLLKIPHYDFTERYPVADAYIRQMIAKVGDKSMDNHGSKLTKDQIQQSQLNTRLSAHIRVLERMGKYDEARDFFQYISPEKRYADPDLNDAYVSVLEHAGTPQEVREFMEATVRANAATPTILEKLERAYIAKKDSTEGYDAYLSQLKSPEELEKIREEMLKHIIDVPYIHFSLEDSDWNIVNSADWGDRVVILDFWGTWCYPCIRAFPGMQMAVDKYKNDPKADFYFISTDDTVESVERFIGRNDYSFNWLYDLETEKNDKPGAVYKYFRELLNVSGVPCKVAVKSGRVRYVSIGYGGSPSRLADELSILIEILKEL